jgi:hypothetical protein
MAGCCSHETQSGQGVCPGHGGECREVPFRTVLHHLRTPWRVGLVSQRYYFCDARDCQVVYFGEDGIRFEQEALRERVGQKGQAGEAMLCYCFDIRYGEAAEDVTLKAYVVEQTRAGLCSCDSRNPSGRCCLKDFPK